MPDRQRGTVHWEPQNRAHRISVPYPTGRPTPSRRSRHRGADQPQTAASRFDTDRHANTFTPYDDEGPTPHAEQQSVPIRLMQTHTTCRMLSLAILRTQSTSSGCMRKAHRHATIEPFKSIFIAFVPSDPACLQIHAQGSQLRIQVNQIHLRSEFPLCPCPR